MRRAKLIKDLAAFVGLSAITVIIFSIFGRGVLVAGTEDLQEVEIQGFLEKYPSEKYTPLERLYIFHHPINGPM